MNRTFRSKFAERIMRFIDQKHAVGHPYVDGERHIWNFDQMCAEHFREEADMTKEVALAWATRKQDESICSLHARLMPIREFGRYLVRTGESAYVLPVKLTKKGNRHIPYIFTETEIALLWAELDNMKPSSASPLRHIVVPAAIRLLYCCGLRPAEVLKLRVSDVDLEKGRLCILESKGSKDRVVMMSDDVAEYYRKFDAQMKMLLPTRTVFFEHSGRRAYTRNRLDEMFQGVRDRIFPGVGERKPVLYDFRHTYATHRLYKWMREGKDLTAMIPYLSAYMGHAQLADTYYYIHLVPGLFENMAGFDYSVFEKLLPEVESYA
ncbi:MAG: tyrosine-type recombinase/integrase [Clostridiales Family XIII bacterium]|jgi:integrase|nr:tyrosine-type recombinase/integrase [Clostridiales Family XIII bacterium]